MTSIEDQFIQAIAAAVARELSRSPIRVDLTCPHCAGARQVASSGDERLLTPEETATALRVTRQTLADWRHKKIGPDYVKQGARVFYTPEAIRDYLNAHTVTTRRS